jgi:alpha-tubulin suppressor-like RCC1 family protein
VFSRGARDDGTWCWGAGGLGQLGYSTNGAAFVSHAAKVAAGPFIAIAAGTQTACAIDPNGNVWCWGSNTQGMAGQDPSVMTVLAGPTKTAVTHAHAISVGVTHACAVVASGDIECWGDNARGELGDNVTNHHHPECGGVDCSWTPVTVAAP